MKPKIGRKVYCVYEDSILVDTVSFVGTDSFIINGFNAGTEEDSWEWNYDDYKDKWFTNLTDAKKRLIELYRDNYHDGYKIEKVNHNCYMIGCIPYEES